MTYDIDTICATAARRFLRGRIDALKVEEFDDIKQEAFLQFDKVLNEFDPDKCTTEFERFAVHRLSLRLIDVARRKSWAPRSIPAENRRYQYPTSPIPEHTRADDGGTSLLERYAGATSDDGLSQLFEQDAMRGLADKLKGVLPGAYREPFELYYVQGMTMKQAGEQLGLTESRICQKLSLARQLIKQRWPGGTGLIAV